MNAAIDVRIFGVPDRIENIRENQKLLGVPDDRIVIDLAHDGCIPTAKRAWGIEPNAPHVLVIQDDVELSDDFLSTCRRIVSVWPDAIVGLYPGQFPRRVQVRRLDPSSPYITTTALSGQGIIMPSRYITPCLASWSDELRGDDVNIGAWAKTNGVLMLTTIPCIIQHLPVRSVFDPSRNLGSTDFFVKDPSGVDWDSDYCMSWTNIIRR